MLDIQRLRDLLTKIPLPPGEELPQGIADADCDLFEQRTGMLLPADLRNWLIMTNGPCVGPGGLFGIRPRRRHLDIEAHLKMYPSWSAKKWIPIAGDGCGNYYVVATGQECGGGYPVLFVDTSASPDIPAYIVASDLEHFVIFLLEAELGDRSWPFRETSVIRADPNIVRFAGVKLPWATG
jgi:hypothetical protein